MFLLAVATFSPAVRNQFLGDDWLLLYRRLDPEHSGLRSLLTQGYWGDIHAGGLYRPLSLAALAAQRGAFGLNPVPYHLVNLALHGFATVLVLTWLGRVTSDLHVRLAGAAVFAVHPIHAEAVTTVYGQQDLWCAVFFLAAMNIGLRTGVGERPLVRSAATGALYLASLLSKEQSILLPVLLIPVLAVPGAGGTRRIARWALVFGIPLSIYALLRANALGSQMLPAADASVASGYPLWVRVNLVVVSVGTSVRLLLLPWAQTTYYGHLRDALFGGPWLEMGVIAMTALSLTPLRHMLGTATVNWAGAMLAVTMFPVANVIPIGMVVGERCLYLPSIAVGLVGGAAYGRAAERWRRTAMAVAVAVIAIGFALSVRVALRWQTPLRHWTATAADHPTSAAAHARVALLLLQDIAGQPDMRADPRLGEAEAAIERALVLNPQLPEAWEARALVAIVDRDCASATAALARAAVIRPSPRDIAGLVQRCSQHP